MREGVNWEELWVLEKCFRVRSDLVRGKLALARIDNATAAAYADYDADRFADLSFMAVALK